MTEATITRPKPQIEASTKAFPSVGRRWSPTSFAGWTPIGAPPIICPWDRFISTINPLLREPLKLAHVKPLVVGHWGTTPGQNFIYVHLNRAIKKYD